MMHGRKNIKLVLVSMAVKHNNVVFDGHTN